MSEENVYTVQVSYDEGSNEPLEQLEAKIFDHLLTRNLISKRDKDFVIREKHRLLKIGYECQLPAILYNSNLITMEILIELYRTICGEEVSVVKQQSVGYSGIPQIRKARKISKAKPMASTKKTSRKATGGKAPKKVAENVPENLQEAILQQSEEYARCIENQTGMDGLPNTKEIEQNLAVLQKSTLGILQSAAQFQEMLNILRKLDSHLSSPVASTSQEKQIVPSEVNTESYNERAEVVRNKTVLSADKALQRIKKGEKLEDCYIRDLSLSSCTFENEVILNGCVLENFEASNAKFAEDADWEGSSFIGKAIFKGTSFAKEAKFKKVLFLDGADFSTVEFNGETRFHSASFIRYVSFNRSKFAKKTIFSYSQFERGAKFTEVEFLAGSSFNNLHCGHRFEMKECKFMDETTFSNAEFADIVDFSKSVFQETAKFIGTIFSKYVTFQYAKFQSDCVMSTATVEGDLLFNNASFSGNIDLEAISAEHNVNFKEAKIGEHSYFQVRDAYFGRLFISIPQLQNHLKSHSKGDYKTAREEYGLLKNNFREINEYECEDWAYLWEKRVARKVAPKIKAFFEWLVLDIPCGYGTKPMNIFPTLFVLFLIFAGFFFAFGEQFNPGVETILPSVENQNTMPPLQPSVGILDSFQISFCTLTNLSIGDWSPRRGSWMNYFMMFESFLGFLLMNVVVVVTFSRKVSR